MNNKGYKQGFTLIEILAVIAILAILIVLVVPNIIKIYRNTKRNAFVTQAQSIYKAAERQSIADELKENITSKYCNDGKTEDQNKLKLTGGKKIYYKVEYEQDKIKLFEISNEEYSIVLTEDSKINEANSKLKERGEEGYIRVNCSGESTGEDNEEPDPEPTLGVSQISAGTNHIVFLMEDGTVKAAGANSDGQLGDGTTTSRSRFENVMLNSTTILTGVKQISSNSWTTVFLMNDGSVKAVGRNASGQLGDGTITYRYYPVDVLEKAATPLTGVKQISAGNEHTVFLMEDGTVKAVGENQYGRLGDGTTTYRYYPVDVLEKAATPLTGVKEVSAAYYHTVFLMNDGSVKAVGYNYQGQLGVGSTSNSYYPAEVKLNSTTALTGVKKVLAESSHTVYLMNDSSVKAGGWNSTGQLGDGTTTQRNYPVEVKLNSTTALTGVKEVSTGDSHTVFLMGDGTVKAVGGNNCGQLGNGTISPNSLYPVDVKTNTATWLTKVKQISAGSFTVYLMNDGSVKAGGCNGNGQLLDGTTTNKCYPIDVYF